MKKDLLLLLLLLIPAIAWLLQPGFFSMHDDLQVVRQLEMARCFADGQIPCRWVLDLGYGFGYPLFNYYPPLPYLIGQPFHWLGFQYIDIVKIVGILGFVVCGLSMYLLAREFWGRSGGILASAVYTYAPYHSVDFYVRGAMNEFWAMALFPLIFWAAYRLIKYQNRKFIPLLSLTIAALMLSHNLMLLIFAPVLVLWCLFWLWRKSNVTMSQFINLTVSALWSLGLAAFFTLPVLFESRFAHVETLTIGYFNFLAHFLDLKQIFFRINWGYGESVYGSGDTMSFALGYLQWILPVIVLLMIFFIKKIRDHKYPILLFLLFTLTSLFFSHYKSTPLWLKVPPLQFLQFPWRFLTLAVFCASFVSGAVVLINRKLLPPLLLLLLLLNANYFRPREWYPDMTDAQKFSGKSWNWQVTGSIFDYLPIYAPLPPRDPAGGDVGITSGEGTYSRLAKRTNFQEYSVDISTPQAIVELQTFYFPGWRVYLDGQEMPVDPKRDPLLGRMQIDVPSGRHTITARFGNTPIRTLGNVLSFISLVAIILYGTSSFHHLTLKNSFDHRVTIDK
jgi:hypothetical protein